MARIPTIIILLTVTVLTGCKATTDHSSAWRSDVFDGAVFVNHDHGGHEDPAIATAKTGPHASKARRLPDHPLRNSKRIIKASHANIRRLDRRLVRLLHKVSRHYGRPVHIQSGYRSPKYNRRIGGARRSYHMRNQAADIKVSGVSKHKLAKFLKTLTGRGGIGVYCSSSTTHIDVGPVRQWWWPCRKRRKRVYTVGKRR